MLARMVLLLLTLLVFVPQPLAAEERKRVLILVSNVADMGDPEKSEAKNNLWEVAPPYHVFTMNGYEVDFASPKGGPVPYSLDVDVTDPPGMISYTLKYEGFRYKSDRSLRPDQVDARQYAGVFIGGGFGPLFDVANDTALLSVIAKIYENGGVVGGCGHGPGNFANVRLSDGRFLVDGIRMTAFPNSTEKNNKWSKAGTLLPFFVEDRLRARGALFQTKADLKDKHDVVIDGRLVTTMFLPSSALVAKEMVTLMSNDN